MQARERRNLSIFLIPREEQNRSARHTVYATHNSFYARGGREIARIHGEEGEPTISLLGKKL